MVSTLFKYYFICFVLIGINIQSSFPAKRFERSNAPVGEQPKKKKLKLNNTQVGQVAPGALVPNSLPNYVASIQFFPHEIWKIITSYATLSGLVRHPFTLRDSQRIIAIDVKTKGKIVQTVVGASGLIALRTSRGFVQVHSSANQMVLEFSTPYIPNCKLELSDDDTMLHVSVPEQVWDFKSGKQLQGVDFDKHKSENQLMHITSQSTELVLSNDRYVHLRNLPQGYKAALDIGEGQHRTIVIPSKHLPEGKRRGVQLFDQRTGSRLLSLPGHYVRQDCFENGGALITTSNNQDFIWDNERAVCRVAQKLTDTKLNRPGNILIGTNELGSRIRAWNLDFLTSTLTVDQTIFLWAIDAYKTWNSMGNPMKLSDLVEFCGDSDSITIEEARRVYGSFNSSLKEILVGTYNIIED